MVFGLDFNSTLGTTGFYLPIGKSGCKDARRGQFERNIFKFTIAVKHILLSAHMGDPLSLSLRFVNHKQTKTLTRKSSILAPGWWDYTTLNDDLLKDAAGLTADDLLSLSRPGFRVVFYDTLEEFYLVVK